MKKFFGYVRVSTARQGEGVSLNEQREAISRYAERHALEIVSWFDERVTAAKRGRPVFNEMLRLLKRGKAAGVIVHKIDRSARNLRDWADLGELIDHGLEVHFVNESLDLNSRGGRLAADIQAVVAADYIRNLREETLKGFYGRIKQGLYPLPAPIGYLDRGKGKEKVLDPVKAPLVKRTFELYSTGCYSIDTLGEEVSRMGLHNVKGGAITRNGLSVLLKNPFYIGLIRLRRTGETFPGIHEPLIPKQVFDRVQGILSGKTNARVLRHRFLFRRLLRCKHCGYSLIGEIQKGIRYYRCHTTDCKTSIREDLIEKEVKRALSSIRLSSKLLAYARGELSVMAANWLRDQQSELNSLQLRRDRISERIARLTDAYVDGALDRALFEERKTAWLTERCEIEERLVRLKEGPSVPDQVAKFLELAESAYLNYEQSFEEEKRDILRIVTSNRVVEGKTIEITLDFPFQVLSESLPESNGGPYRDRPRTLSHLLSKLSTYFTDNPETDWGVLTTDKARIAA
jgi:DNA invertase Pin-like site-specific DNA recombinase